jgi:hypothetical protein
LLLLRRDKDSRSTPYQEERVMTRYHDVIRQLDPQKLRTVTPDSGDACWMTRLHVNAMTIPTSMTPADAAHSAGKMHRDE